MNTLDIKPTNINSVTYLNMGCSKTEEEVSCSDWLFVFINDSNDWVKAQYVPSIDEFIDTEYSIVINPIGWLSPTNSTQTNKITEKSSEFDITCYWNKMFESRMPKEQELWRLEVFALGYYAKHLDFEKKEKRHPEHLNFLEFLKNDKRPFGNKNTVQSIIYCLGWDSQWVMRIKCQPDFVTNEANELYQSLIIEIEKSWEEKSKINDDIWKL